MMLSQDPSLTDVFSYLLLADGLRLSGARSECHELFRRMEFSMLIDNTDDHEKNHSLVLQSGKWHLSKAYGAADIETLERSIDCDELLSIRRAIR